MGTDAPWGAMTWPPADDVVLAGDVVRLTPTDGGRDAAALFAALDHDDVWRHVAGRPDDAATAAVRLQQRLDVGWFSWTATLLVPHAGLPAGAVVGTSSFLDVAVPDARLEIGATTWTPAVWATAVNPEAKLLMLQHAFEVLGCGRVQLKTDIRNTRSQQAISRLGAEREGVLRSYQRRSDGTLRDTVVFSVVAAQWPTVRDGLRDRLATGRR